MNKLLQQRLLVPGVLAMGVYLSPISHAVAQEFSPTAFTECSVYAYLTQGTLSRTYGVDLLTGDYSVYAENHSHQGVTDTGRLNALGFNPNDRFVYGWSYTLRQPVRVHSDWSAEALTDNANITDRDFYVGDVSIPENRYYVYHPGSSYGLYYFELDPDNQNYLVMTKVPGSETMNLSIADMAFHPSNGLAYTVDRNGNLYSIDPATGASEWMADTGISGTFGAAYFDAEGNLYVGKNQDGKIFRVSIDAGIYEAELFSSGPSSTFNDGFRCAIADVVVDQANLLDFGDAPDSYGTTIESNGARHGLQSNASALDPSASASDPSNQNTQAFNDVFADGQSSVRLGTAVDGESNAYAYPLSDGESGNDEDGVTFIGNIVEHRIARVQINAPEGGYLSVWLDTDRNGVFDTVDQVVTDQLMNPGEQLLSFTVPSGVNPGDTWTRFRISSTTGLEATGGAADGEVEDYPVTLLADPVSIATYPSKTGWSTVTFEDNWPFVGDYDMNDLVTQLRTHTYKDSRGYTQVDIEGRINASGAFYENGFGIRLPGVARDAVDEANIQFTLSDRASTDSPLEAGRNEAILLISENVFDHVAAGPGCTFYRTEPGCGAAIEFNFKVSVPFSTPQSAQLNGVFDPFLFATPGAFHGAHFATAPGRSYEIHLKNQAPTEAFDASLFAGLGQDASAPNGGLFYLTDNGMPWALEIGDDWQHPLEYVEISEAYPQFADWATSNGQVNTEWYLKENSVAELTFSE